MSDPPKQFRLESANIAVPKWGRMCNWTARDDAMLLLGLHWYLRCLSAFTTFPVQLLSSARGFILL